MSYELADDRPSIPTRSKSSEFHCLEKGIRNYIYYPQSPISVRTFESEYEITIEVNATSERDAVAMAQDRFRIVASVLSLVAKNKTVKLGKRRIKRGGETYAFEMMAIFVNIKKQWMRIKLPDPLVNGRNFFPKPFPTRFVAQAKKYLSFQDQTFIKGLIYYQRATAMRYSGVFYHVEIILNLVKCIELIVWSIGDLDRFGLPKKQYKNLPTKKAIELSGKKIGVTKQEINNAKKFWDVRNESDVAHEHTYFNPFSPMSTNVLINFDELQLIAGRFLTKYWEYKTKNS